MGLHFLSKFVACVFALFVGSALGQIPPQAAAHKRVAIASWRSVYGLEAPTATLAAQVHQESSWNQSALSRTGAFGLTQFMPGTAKDVQARYAKQFGGLPMTSNVWQFKAQAFYMLELQKANASAANPCEQMAFALAGYNGGQGWVNRRKRASTEPGYCFGKTCSINPGITPGNQKENQEYPLRILKKIEPRYVDALWGKGSCQPTPMPLQLP